MRSQASALVGTVKERLHSTRFRLGAVVWACVGIASAMMGISLTSVPLPNLVLALSIVFLGPLVAYVVLEVFFSGSANTLRTWVRLQTQFGDIWQCFIGGNGDPETRRVSQERRKDAAPDTTRHSGSLAMSPDGDVVAVVRNSSMSIWTIGPWGGGVYLHSWLGNVDIPGEEVAVLAVVPEGDDQVLCLFNSTLDMTLWRLKKPTGLMGRGKEISHYDRRDKCAAFCGPLLLYVGQRGRVKMMLPHEEVPQPGDERDWAPANWRQPADDTHQVIAVDAAVVGGRTVVALLVERQGGAEKPQLVVVPDDQEDRPAAVRDVPGDTVDVSIVRAPGDDYSDACVLFVAGRRVQEFFPFSSKRSLKPGVVA